MNSKISKERIVAALDIGSDSIKLALGKYNSIEDRLEIINLMQNSCNGVSSGLVSNIEKVGQSIKELVNEVEEKNGLTVNVFKVGLADLSLQSENFKRILRSNSLEAPVKVEDIVQFKTETKEEWHRKDKELIYLSTQSYVLDNKFETMDPVGQVCKELESNFAAYYLSSVGTKNISRVTESINKHIDSINISNFASSLSIITQEEKDGGICIIDIGKSTTKLTIFSRGILEDSVIFPIGSDNITLDIKEAFALMAPQAEKIKIKFSSSMCQNVDPSVGLEVEDRFTKSQRTIPLLLT